MRIDQRKRSFTGTQVAVTADECGDNPEKMIRKFSKKVKREGLLEEMRDRMHFVKPSVVRAKKKRETKRVIQNVNKKREELFTSRDTFKKRRR
jgi:ribosomal protein S21|tara:strand:- start:1670 stop:1948 length:279 start_codon:yes stop_codon:yes gene_type:complete